jgi:DNA-binding transcriptional LysR family regulator
MDIRELNLRHLRAAVEINRLGSVSAAALAVSLTQPAVTQGISRLEQQLGVNLFERRADGMQATEAARVFCPRVEVALTLIGSARVTMAQINAFLAVGAVGSFAVAHRMIGLTEASLHRAVKDLSVGLRRSLVERRGRGIVVSEFGLTTLRAFRLACRELEAGIEELNALRGIDSGRIVIGAMPLSRARLLPKAVARFHADFPTVSIKILEGSFAELVDILRNGEADLLIGALRPNAGEIEIEQNPLFSDRPVVFGRTNHPLASVQKPQQHLAQYPWVLPAKGTPLRTQWEEMMQALEQPIPQVQIECGSVIAVREMLRESDFLTLLSPDQLAVEVASGLLVAICKAPDHIRRTIGTITRHGFRPTPSQAAFLAILAQTALGLGTPNSGS